MAKISRAGFGKPGYCSLCEFIDQKGLTEKIEAGWNARQINDWLKQNHGITRSRETIYRHKDHVKNPADRLVNSQRRREAEHGTLPRKSSNSEYLEAVRDAAMQRVLDDPDAVSIQDGLKAAQILENSKRQDSSLLIFAQLMTGHISVPALPAPRPALTEGEYREVTGD